MPGRQQTHLLFSMMILVRNKMMNAFDDIIKMQIWRDFSLLNQLRILFLRFKPLFGSQEAIGVADMIVALDAGRISHWIHPNSG